MNIKAKSLPDLIQILLLILLSLSMLSASCKKQGAKPDEENKTSCDTANIQNLPWIRKLISQPPIDLEIWQAAFNGETVFAVYSCGRCFAGPSLTINKCDGTILCSGLLLVNKEAAGSCSKMVEKLQNKRLVYKAEK